MALKAALFVLAFFFFFFVTSTTISSSNAEEYFVEGIAEPPAVGRHAAPSPAPAPHPHIFVNYEECPAACKARCRLQSRQGLCNRVCMTCCKGCKCVPPGTAGNRELCGPCYTDWTTHGNRTKCP